MNSFTSEFTRLATPQLMDHFGERDANGDYKPLAYRDPRAGNGEPFLFTGISSAVRSIEEPVFDEGMVRRETKTWEIPREQLDARSIDHPQRKATVEDHDGVWNIDVSQCVWGPTFVTLALTRAPRTSGNELTRAAV